MKFDPTKIRMDTVDCFDRILYEDKVVAKFDENAESKRVAEYTLEALRQKLQHDSDPLNFHLFNAVWRAVQMQHAMQMAKSGFSEAPVNMGEALMLMTSELAEALEYDRKGNGQSDHIPEFLGVEEELADTVLRIMHLASRKGYRIAEAIEAKLAFNATRDYKHGGKAY